MDSEYIKSVRELFGLNVEPFTEIDDYLVLLAVKPTCNILKNENNIVKQKYQTCNHQALEFYGDSVLYTIISMILINEFSLKGRPGPLTDYKHFITNNKTLTNLLLDKCIQLTGYPKNKTYYTKSHNICADTFEAIIGALFYHFYRIKGNPNFIDSIYNWIITNTNIVHALTDMMIKRSDYPTLLMTKNISERILPSESELISALGEESAKELLKDLANEPKSGATLIVTPTTTINDIYSNFGWGEPKVQQDNNLFFLNAKIKGEDYPIGIGTSEMDAINSAKKWLLRNNYIIIKSPA